MKARNRFFVDGVSCRLDAETYRVANLSARGFFAAAGEPLPHVGQILVLDLVLPSRRACRVVGRVTWINGRGEHVSELPPGFGVRLTRIDREDRQAIEDLLRGSDAVLGPGEPDREEP